MLWIFALVVLLGVAAAALPTVLEKRRRVMDSAARQGAPGKFVTLSQGVTHYQWHGPVRGPVAVCIHGLTTPGFVWDGIAKGLTMMGFRVLTYDLYGRGYSDRPKGAQDKAFFQRQLNDLLDALEVQQDITLLGYSMGGSIAACFAAEQPHRVHRLILIAPAGLAHTTARFFDFVQKTPLLGDWVMLVFGSAYFHRGLLDSKTFSAEQLRQLADESRTQGYLTSVLSSQRGMLAQDLTEEHDVIARTSLPVLAIWGEQDTVIPLTALGLLAEINRVAYQATIAGADHALLQTHPREVVKEIQDFIREV